MAIDTDFVKNFENQIKVLERLKQAAEEAIERANQRLGQLKSGEPIEKVFGAVPPKQ